MTNGSANQGGIVTRQYKSGSIIYFENDKSEYIYILKAGRVILTSIKLDTGEEVKEDVRHGEFFGVKSALGRYPREETAQTIGETTVLVLRLADFERLILKNVNVVRKMLRVFSNQLRKIHKMVRSALGEGDNVSPAQELFRIGEYYYHAGVYKQAMYAYKKYMEHYPDTEYAAQAMQRIKEINSGQVSPGSVNMDFSEPAVSPKGDSHDMSDFTLESEHEEAADFNGDVEDSKASISDEMDDFLSDDAGLGDLDDFSFDEPAGKKGTKSAEQKFAEADTLFKNNKLAEALQLYEDVLNSGQGTDDNILGRIYLGMGKCHGRLGQQKAAMENYSTIIKQYGSSPYVKNAFFEIAAMFESARQKDKAVLYYKKAATMPPRDAVSEQAMMKIKQLQ